jgi:hypothetical protein
MKSTATRPTTDDQCIEADDPYRDFYEKAQFVTGLFLYPIVCSIGLVGNVLTVAVLNGSRMRSSTNSYLVALAISDAIKLIVDSVYFLVIVALNVDPVFGKQAYGYLYPYAHYFFNVSLCTTAWLTVSVAAERYVLVCRSPSSRRRGSVRRSQLISGFVFCSMAALSAPFAFRYQTVFIADNATNMTVAHPEVTDLWLNDDFAAAYTWFQNLLRSVVPLLLLGLLNALIVRALLKTRSAFGSTPLSGARPSDKHDDGGQRVSVVDAACTGSNFTSVTATTAASRRIDKHAMRFAVHRRRIAVMLVTVVVMFTLCVTPDAVMSTVFGFGYYDEDYLIRGIREITDLLLAVNSAFNFVVYYAFNPAFRRRLRSTVYRICCCYCCCGCLLSPPSASRGGGKNNAADANRRGAGICGTAGANNGATGERRHQHGGILFHLRRLGRSSGAPGTGGLTTGAGLQFRSTGFATARRTSPLSNVEDDADSSGANVQERCKF